MSWLGMCLDVFGVPIPSDQWMYGRSIGSEVLLVHVPDQGKGPTAASLLNSFFYGQKIGICEGHSSSYHFLHAVLYWVYRFSVNLQEGLQSARVASVETQRWYSLDWSRGLKFLYITFLYSTCAVVFISLCQYKASQSYPIIPILVYCSIVGSLLVSGGWLCLLFSLVTQPQPGFDSSFLAAGAHWIWLDTVGIRGSMVSLVAKTPKWFNMNHLSELSHI